MKSKNEVAKVAGGQTKKRQGRRSEEPAGIMLVGLLFLALIVLSGFLSGCATTSSKFTKAEVVTPIPLPEASSALLNATVYRLELSPKIKNEFEWNRSAIDEQLASRMVGITWMDGADAVNEPSKSIQKYLSQFGQTRVALSQSQPFLVGEPVEVFSGREEPFLTARFSSSDSSNINSVTQQTMSSGIRVKLKSELRGADQILLEYDVSIDETYKKKTSLHKNPNRRIPVKAGEQPPEKTDEVETNKEDVYSLLGRLRANMDGEFITKPDAINVFTHQRAAEDNTSIIFVLVLEVASMN